MQSTIIRLKHVFISLTLHWAYFLIVTNLDYKTNITKSVFFLILDLYPLYPNNSLQKKTHTWMTAFFLWYFSPSFLVTILTTMLGWSQFSVLADADTCFIFFLSSI